MTAHSYTIRPVELSDIPALGDLLYTSKLALTINRLLFKNWPNEAAQRQNYLGALEGIEVDSPESRTVVDNVTGEVIGHLALNRRRPVERPEQSHGGIKKPDLPDFFAPEVVTAVLEAVATIDQEVETTDRYEITYIVVKSEYRHRGIGKDLMDYVFNKARSAGVPVAVSAEPQVYEFFKKYGFHDTKHVDFDLAQWAPPHSGFGIFRLAGLTWHP
ncbi:acyl-CoA N-acyltransferase [Aspergillus pseudocaelatus]|uniref:Acyl-CoA N-acyltransferase n=1 Tax=Aspergillus pseudocaelatus TaxID=1825620 RepID=A0ABQ6WBE7_9EURO|nr:acyl-CoA N-acyltransferase [Aspergillus pseudocaelatus]